MKKILILFGAKSYEHEISIVSAISMKKVLRNNLIYIFVDQNRELYHIPTDKITAKMISSYEYKKCDKVSFAYGGFEKKSLFGSKPIEFDVVLNLIHGGDGEDGVMAGLLQFFNIPFIGPRTEACTVSFDKYLTKIYAAGCSVKSLDYICITKKERENFQLEKYPVIIKPARLGSSIGVGVVKSSEQLQYALDVAFEFDDKIIIEPFIEGVKEYNLAGAKVNGELLFSIVEEPQKNDFLDFDKKYLDFSRTTQVQKAQIDSKLQEDLQNQFAKIYNNLFEGALIRCDFFVVDGEIYLNEINTIPGSMANYLFDDFNTLVEQLANSLPKTKNITVQYEYVNRINSAKGK